MFHSRLRISKVFYFLLGLILVHTTWNNILLPTREVALDSVVETNLQGFREATTPSNVDQANRIELWGEAYDQEKKLGYRVDPFRLRLLKTLELQNLMFPTHNNVPSPIWFNSDGEREAVCQTPPGMGVEKQAGWNLLQRVVLNGHNPAPEKRFMSEKEQLTTETSTIIDTRIRAHNPSNDTESPKILCVVYTHAANHARLRAQEDTWGWRCSGFFAASTKTDETLSSIDLAHIGPETYENMWRK